MGYRSTWKLALKAPKPQIESFKQWLKDGAGNSYEADDLSEEWKYTVEFFEQCEDDEVEGGVIYSHDYSKCGDVFCELISNIEAYAENAEPPLMFSYARVGDDTTDQEVRQSHDDFCLTCSVSVEIEWPVDWAEELSKSEE